MGGTICKIVLRFHSKIKRYNRPKVVKKASFGRFIFI